MPYSKDVDGKVWAHDLVSQLVDASVITGTQAADIVATSRNVEMTVPVQFLSDELVEHAATRALREELEERTDYTAPTAVDVHLLADALRHVKAGEAFVAEALIARAFDGVDIEPIMRALRS
ncbi:hypothetical protein Q5H91_04065 [Sphingomonas sp. KR1UV-12]|uniref:Uncharacterized protein n=1 Tax=Sphingomonas aurea TaxID=3063994 RepID=A0ABT9EHS3_9SPHN|nr:hypothetical protein [Sphingomonas sp. KR1UV-12]MDP1026377.1 hypothetical protein [Sphingomonas sp. KR1UV-12]